MNFTTPFGEWLKRHRKALGLTQKDLAHRAHYSVGMIRKLESGTLHPSRQATVALADALNIPQRQRADFLNFARGVESGSRKDNPYWATNLPVMTTSLIGRALDVQTACDLLLRDSTRLLTLFGPPGVGKTRLAIAIAESLRDRFDDGVYFVSLAPVSELDDVSNAIAQALGVRLTPNVAPTGSLLGYLHEKHLLLILDNFEHLLAAVPLVSELLVGAPALYTIVTSRVVLRLTGEQALEVSPLACPPMVSTQSTGEPATLKRYAAVELFEQRARAAKPSFTLNSANEAAVAEICRRLDGLPLAIELAALRTRMFKPGTLLAHLDHHIGNAMRLLTVAPRDLPARQQTLRNTLDWSHSLLSAEEQALFRRLGVFVGGCTLEAALAVCDFEFPLNDPAAHATTGLLLHFERCYDPAKVSEPQTCMAGLIESLLDKSLLQQSDGFDGQPRYTMLETIREYALEQLQMQEEAGTAFQRHQLYFTLLAEAYDDERLSLQQAGWQRELEADVANLRAAVGRGLEAESDPVMTLRLSVALTWFWVRHAYHWGRVSDLAEQREWLVRAQAMRPLIPLALKAKVCHRLAWMEFEQLDYKSAALQGDAFLALRREIGDTAGIAYALYARAVIAQAQGEGTRAEQLLLEALNLSHELGMQPEIAATLGLLGYIALDCGEFDRAAGWLENALTVTRQTGIVASAGMTGGIIRTLRDLGLVRLLQADYARADSLLMEGLQLCQAEDNKYNQGLLLLYLAHSALAEGQPALAIARLRDGLQALKDIGEIALVVASLTQLSEALFTQGRVQDAVRLAGAASANNPQPAGSSHHYTFLKFDQERIITAMRARLGDPALAAAWTQGERMMIEQAVTDALVSA